MRAPEHEQRDPLADLHRDALALLRRNGVSAERIVKVDVDAILFLDPDCKPKTAWLRKRPGVSVFVDVRLEAGFCAERGVEFPGEAAAREYDDA